MKSTTLRRSNVSKERIKSIEALSKYRRRNYTNTQAMGIQPIKDKELDILWQDMEHSAAKYEKSPLVYIITGFILGAVSMLILTTIINLSVNAVKDSEFEEAPIPVAATTEDTKLTFIPADTTEAKNLTKETYTIQSGDTLESIVIRFYGFYSSDKAKKIEEVNNITNPNQLKLGQVLTIPLGEE